MPLPKARSFHGISDSMTGRTLFLGQIDLYDIDKASENPKNLANISQELFFSKLRNDFADVVECIVTAEQKCGDDFGERTQNIFHFFLKFIQKQEPKIIIDKLYYLITSCRPGVVFNNKNYEIKLITAGSYKSALLSCSKYFEHKPLFFGIDPEKLHTVYHGQIWIDECLKNLKDEKFLPEKNHFFERKNIDKNLWRHRLEAAVSAFNAKSKIKSYEEFLNIPVVPLSGEKYNNWKKNL
jgi:hypothetical protein